MKQSTFWRCFRTLCC